ncbi:EF-P beta-lysylation protein EpmB [Salinisphaera sp. LB1]|uniref:EF-P beta-lysylation protein EpmB n=1 Tax=Salinisphaera sp. LB1 TaxID=2183911 RepID=UPI000D705F0E|nr:EF-P beta-lysylation protein EpmB [Salinisphaera sp. LB1]AWN17464.1 Lysyl-lysine 2,3-aminomutase [Salinisphaera sp. LB1]
MSTRPAPSRITPLIEPRSLSYRSGGWQQAMRDAITDVDTLFAELDLPAEYKPAARRAAALFDLRVPRGYVARMRRGDIADPLLRQVLPLHAECHDPPGFVDDAVGDNSSAVGDGLLHKYHGRALLVTTGACAVHCRYCFRRHFDYSAQHAGGSHTEAALARIAADPSITEVILSGGDPLSLSNARLDALGARLDAIDHVRRLRIHTRTPVVLPERVDDGLLAWFAARRARTVVVLHVNHAAELSFDVADIARAIAGTGAVPLNQAVLLAGVNDDADTLADLSLALFDAGVMPYYLHLLDRVRGTHHFEVPEARAVVLMQALAARLPGYLVPKLAREGPGDDAKSVLGVPARARHAGLRGQGD